LNLTFILKVATWEGISCIGRNLWWFKVSFGKGKKIAGQSILLGFVVIARAALPDINFDLPHRIRTHFDQLLYNRVELDIISTVQCSKWLSHC
jgi:hypothetical protein